MWQVYIDMNITSDFVSTVLADFSIEMISWAKSNDSFQFFAKADKKQLKKAMIEIIKIFGCDINITEASSDEL